MEQGSEYQKDINNLYNKTNALDKKLMEIDINQKHYTETLEKVVESNDKLVNTLQSMQLTFVKMDSKIDVMSENLSATKDQVDGIDTRMKKIESDNQFEIMGFMKKYFPWIIATMGLVVAYASQYIKF